MFDKISSNSGEAQTILDAFHLQKEKRSGSGRTDTEHQPPTSILSFFFRGK